MTLVLAGSVRFPAEHVDAVRPHAAAMVAATHEEPGCISYSMAWSVVEPGVLHIFEHFDDEAALAFHRASPHMATWRERMAEFDMSGRDMRQYDLSDYRQI